MVAYVLVVFLVPIYASDFAQGGSIGSGVATIPSGSGGACTGSIFGGDDSDLQMVVLLVVVLYMVEVF